MLLKNKLGQVGETITWIVATLVIIVIISFSVFVTSNIGDDKEFESANIADSVATKSLLGYLITSQGEEGIVYNQLKKVEGQEIFDSTNGLLAQNIFKDFYEKEYPYGIWLGIYSSDIGAKKNDYFKARPHNIRGGDLRFGERYVPYVSEKINLDNNNQLELVLMDK